MKILTIHCDHQRVLPYVQLIDASFTALHSCDIHVYSFKREIFVPCFLLSMQEYLLNFHDTHPHIHVHMHTHNYCNFNLHQPFTRPHE